MFTGLIESLGTIVSTESAQDGLLLTVSLGELDPESIQIGDSIAVSGACLTVTKLEQINATFDVSNETLSKCLIGTWQVNDQVNLERALTLEKALGGHLVSGHVDGSGKLELREDGDKTTQLQFSAPRAIGRYIAIKGSITVDGISLTSNQVVDQGEDTLFNLTIVPHTLAMTTLGTIKQGDRVHLEIDLIARYLDRLMASDQTTKPAP